MPIIPQERENCSCINFVLKFNRNDGDGVITLIEYDVQSGIVGQYNGHNYYVFNLPGVGDLFMYVSLYNNRWEIGLSLDDVGGYLYGYSSIYKDVPICPFGILNDFWTSNIPNTTEFTTKLCIDGTCTIKAQDRDKIEYTSVKLPKVVVDEDRGFKRCCCNYMVLASGSSDSWKNDKTSAWIKLSSSFDTADLVIKSCDGTLNYVPTKNAFLKEENAFYWTINWNDVLNESGEGHYQVVISYNISGITQEFVWGVYDLKPFTIQNALQTARIRVYYNSMQEIEGIDFTGTKVEDTIRFHGFIGKRQPNMEIDNLVYQNREIKKVVRENLNTYEILVDPTCEGVVSKMVDLFLLSENDLFISDYNKFNHSYKYNDLPVIVESSPEITYYDLDRKAGLRCVVSDKFKNKRSFFK